MRTILISLILVMFTRVVYGDAVIFSGNDVKALKQNLDLFGTSKLMGTATDPSSGGGLSAPLSSIAMNYVTGIGYIKTSAPNTGWSRIVDTAYAPGVYFSQGGNAFGAAGVLGTTDANRLDLITGGVVGMSMATGGAVTLTSASATALSAGPNGATNPAFQIDSSTASAVTGIKITAAAAGGGSKIEAISSAANEDIILTPKGTAGSFKLQVGGSNKYIATAQSHTFSVSATGTAASIRFGFTGTADTNMTASTEAPSVYFNIGQTRQHATGALALQRDFRVTPSTHSFVGASTLTNAAGFAVDGAPIAGTNATITNSSAIYTPGNAVTSSVTNSYGLNINANTGATNNYSAIFNGGSVGIGTSSPSSILQTYENNTSTGNSNGITIEQAGTGDAVMHYLLTGVQRYTMGIDNSDSDKFKIGTNADLGISNLLTITSAGLVGIGNSNPGYTLEVSGQTKITGVNSILMDPATGTIYTGAGLGNISTLSNGKITTPTAGPFIERNVADANPALIVSNTSATSTGDITQFKSNGTVKARFTYAGNLGVGIAAPTSNIHQDAGTGTATYHQFTANATTGQTATDGTLIGIDASGNAIFNNQEAAYINFLSSNTQRARITALGSLVVGNNSSALATSATDGFLYISSSAGAPTGTPVTQTGSVPIHVDATNNAMYMYTNGAWRGANNSAVQGSRQTGTSMSVGTAITPALGSKTVAFVVGNGGAITITASPPITTTGMIVGQELRVCGTSNTNTVTYNNSVNLVLTGSATLGKDQCLDLMFSGTDGTNLSWIETGRSF